MSLSNIMSLGFGGFTLGSLLSAIVAFIICYIAIRIANTIVQKLLAKATKLDGTICGFICTVVKVLLWVLAIIIVADMLGISTASLVALMSVVTLALSLSVQNIMSNLFSGVTLLITKPFVQGDFVDISGKSGTIKSVGLFYTVVDTVDNVVVSIPNSDVTSSAINNYSTEPLRRVDFKFCASYDSPTATVKKAITDAINADDKILKDPEPFIKLSGYNASDIEYTVRVWCESANYWDVYFNMYEKIRETFATNGVEFAYPHVQYITETKKN